MQGQPGCAPLTVVVSCRTFTRCYQPVRSPGVLVQCGIVAIESDEIIGNSAYLIMRKHKFFLEAAERDVAEEVARLNQEHAAGRWS